MNADADLDGGGDARWEVLLRNGDARASVIVPPVALNAELVARIAKAELEDHVSKAELDDYEVVAVTFHPGSQRVR